MRGAVAKDRVAKPSVSKKPVSVASMFKIKPTENAKSSHAAHGPDPRKKSLMHKKRPTQEPPHPLALAFRGKFSLPI